MSHDIGGLWDDVSEGLRWKPILPLVKKARESRGLAKADAIREVVRFALVALEVEPANSRAFRMLSLVVDLAASDARVRAAVEDLLPLS